MVAVKQHKLTGSQLCGPEGRRGLQAGVHRAGSLRRLRGGEGGIHVLAFPAARGAHTPLLALPPPGVPATRRASRLLRAHTSLRPRLGKDPCDQTGPTQMTRAVPYPRSRSHLHSPFRHPRSHIHRFWGSDRGHLGGHTSNPREPRDPAPQSHPPRLGPGALRSSLSLQS